MAVNAWSHSVLDSFDTCAYRHYLTKVTKDVVEPQSKEMVWGNLVHKALELRCTVGKPLPEGMTQWEPIARTVDAAKAAGSHVSAEGKMALDISLRPCSYFAKDINKENLVWVRGAADLIVERRTKARILDWKTGKPKPNSAQMKLMAGMVFAAKPYLEEIATAFVWLKTPGTAPTVEHFTRDDVPGIWQEMLPKVQRLDYALAENKWPKKPSGLCGGGWCPVPHGTGPGKCEHRR